MKQYGVLKQYILEILGDEKEHSIEELVGKYVNGSVSNANVCTAISQLIKNGEAIKRVSKGTYVMEKN